MLLLGITGRKGSGKDTLFQFVDEWCVEHDAASVRRGFADKLKLSCCRLFYPDCTLEFALEWADVIKNSDGDGGVTFNEVETILSQQPMVDHEYIIKTIVTGRELLQRYGTEAHRDVFGDNFWVDQLLPFSEWRGTPAWWENFPDSDLAVVTDCRFENEAQRIMELGEQIWEVSRPSADDAEDGHASEKPLPRTMVDLIVTNDGTLADLRDQVGVYCSRHVFDCIKAGSWQA